MTAAKCPSLKDASKEINWIARGSNLTSDEVNTGCLLRIADATEAMAGNYIRMQKDLEYYKQAYSVAVSRASRLERQRAALKGVVTRLQNQIREITARTEPEK